MRAVYSHSRLTNFETCPRRFQYRYVLKLPAEVESIEAFVGKRVHEVLERLYRFTDRGLVPSLEKVVRRYQVFWDEAWDAERVTIARDGYTAEFYRQKGDRCLRNYYARHYPFDGDETLGLEHHVDFALDDAGDYRMQGVIDRLVRARDGTLEIHDYKTGARVPSQSQLDQDRQLALYQIGVAERFGPDRPFRLVWHFVRKGITRTSTRTPDQLDDLRHETLDLVRRVQSESKFPPTPGPLCRWCEFSERCPGSPERRPDLPTWEEVYAAPPAPELDPRQLAFPL